MYDYILSGFVRWLNSFVSVESNCSSAERWFGSFKIGLTSAGADKASDFDVRKQIKGLHVCFTPEAKTDSAGTRRKTFLIGATVQEAPKNAVDKSEDEEAETQEP